MHLLQSIIWWFAGGLETPYHSLSHCMHKDWFWITVTVTLDLLVAAGYMVIAYHWSRNEKLLPSSPAKQALRTLRNIFLFCGICGYIFIPIKMFWPAWRLYDLFMVALVFNTWRYALNAVNLKVIYTAIGESRQLAVDLAKSRDDSKRKSFFLNALSHDLRTPLNGMLLHANLAEMHITSTDGTAAQHSINEIKGSIRTTVEMLEGLLEYARLESPDEIVTKSEVDLSKLLNDIYSNHQPVAARKSLELTCTPCDGVMLKTDRLRLERILNNLVGNAVKFTSVGTIRIEVEPLPATVQIAVVDTGIGIAPEHQSRLFEEFFQVQNYERDRQKGFGMGLAICQRLVGQLDGELLVQSESGKGSRFTVVLPRGTGSNGSGALGTGPAGQPAKNTQ